MNPSINCVVRDIEDDEDGPSWDADSSYDIEGTEGYGEDDDE